MIKKILQEYLKFKNEDIVFIYQMGKVASRTIQESVEAVGYKTWPLHNAGRHINKQLFGNYKNPSNFSFKEKIKNVFSIINKQAAIRILKAKENLKIITIIREPISRNESFFFQDLHIPLCQMNKRNWTWVYQKDNIDALTEEYFTSLNKDHGINWFDNEIKKYLGIDVYKYPFSQSDGYSIIKQKNMELLILKLERLNEYDSSIFNDFLGVDNFTLINQNIGQDKWYSGLYKEFKSKVTYSKEYVDSMYNSEYMRHFYSEEEIAKFRSGIKIQD